MTDSNNPNSDSCTDPDCSCDSDESSKDTSDGRTKIEYRAGDLSVQAETEGGDPEHLDDILSEQMDEMMRMRMIGEYEVLEERDLHSVLLGGGDR
jgi:hypothetical protein